MSRKEKFLGEVKQLLAEKVEAVEKAFSDSSAAATDPDSKAESKYDTRSLEMSYLAAGQAEKLRLAREEVERLEKFSLREFAVSDEIGEGALVEVEREGVWKSYLLLPAGGGLTFEDEDGLVTILGPGSPLFESLKGARLGQEFGFEGDVVSEIC